MLVRLKGVISLFLYTINMVLHAVFILCLAPLVLLIPLRSWRVAVQRGFLQRIPESYFRINCWIMMISTRNHWDILGTGTLKKAGWYMLVSNHVSWIDIFVLGKVFSGKIPTLKFFMKKELLWQLPFAGLACYALGFPFMSRHSHAEIKKNPSLKGKDIETTKKACRALRHFPTTLINFAEGTRFTEKKRDRQQSPFKNLLKPHAGGVAVVLHELHQNMSGILSVVISYSPRVPSFWDFACGRFDKIAVRYELLPISQEIIGDYHNDRNFRPTIQQWFNEIWQRNDALIERFKTNYENPTQNSDTQK